MCLFLSNPFFIRHPCGLTSWIKNPHHAMEFSMLHGLLNQGHCFFLSAVLGACRSLNTHLLEVRGDLFKILLLTGVRAQYPRTVS